jgi:hypothetical protein
MKEAGKIDPVSSSVITNEENVKKTILICETIEKEENKIITQDPEKPLLDDIRKNGFIIDGFKVKTMAVKPEGTGIIGNIIGSIDLLKLDALRKLISGENMSN